MDSQIWQLTAMFLVLLGSGYMTVMGVWSLAADRARVADRLRGSGRHETPGRRVTASLSQDDGALRGLSRYVSPKRQDELTAIRMRLIRAGRRNESAVRWYYLQKGIYGLIFALITVFYLTVLMTSAPALMQVALILGMTVLGMMAPTFLLSRAIQTRQEAIQRGFPDAVDMLLVCVEAGMGLDQALARLSSELTQSCPVLADEFSQVCAELRAGKPRGDVLRDFAERTGIDDVKALVTVLNQSVEFGVSIAESLRVFSAEMRYKRIMRAEETANAMPMKLALGSVLFTIPPVGILLAGPSIMMMLASFSSMGGG